MTISVSIGKREKAGARINVAQCLFLIFWVLKPFYFRPSGNIQVSDIVFAASFGAWVIQNGWRIRVDVKERFFLLFLFCVFLINGLYYLRYQETEFLESCLYLLYNLFIILEVRDLSHDRRFLKLLLYATAINFFVQLAVYRTDRGSYLYERLRYMGTFNDPNQFSFSMFSSFLLTVLLASFFKDQEGHRRKLWPIVSMALAAYFILLGNSAGMLLGLAAFAAALPFMFVYSERTPGILLIRYFAFILLALMLFFLFVNGFPIQWIKAVFGEDSFFTVRLNEKLYSARTGGLMAFFSDRGIDKMVRYPQYLLFGAGDGLYTRFVDSSFEVHSTLPGILFCYGLIPFCLLCRWIWDNLKGMSLTLLPIYLALLVESVTLAHHRQPVFWMLILLGALPFKDRGLRKYRIVKEI